MKWWAILARRPSMTNGTEFVMCLGAIAGAGKSAAVCMRVIIE